MNTPYFSEKNARDLVCASADPLERVLRQTQRLFHERKSHSNMRVFAAWLLPLLCFMTLNSAHCAQISVVAQYALHCSGCHGLQGHGLASSGIPDLRQAGRYAGTEAGRRYLLAVPGISASGLKDEDLAILLNWVLERFCSDQPAGEVKKFTASEVAAGRANFATDAPRQRLQLPGR
jgi:hypothetical protein